MNWRGERIDELLEGVDYNFYERWVVVRLGVGYLGKRIVEGERILINIYGMYMI